MWIKGQWLHFFQQYQCSLYLCLQKCENEGVNTIVPIFFPGYSCGVQLAELPGYFLTSFHHTHIHRIGNQIQVRILSKTEYTVLTTKLLYSYTLEGELEHECSGCTSDHELDNYSKVRVNQAFGCRHKSVYTYLHNRKGIIIY